MSAPLNLIDGIACPPVVCRRREPWLSWHDGDGWREGNELPAAIYDAQPDSERRRIDNHLLVNRAI